MSLPPDKPTELQKANYKEAFFTELRKPGGIFERVAALEAAFSALMADFEPHRGLLPQEWDFSRIRLPKHRGPDDPPPPQARAEQLARTTEKLVMEHMRLLNMLGETGAMFQSPRMTMQHLEAVRDTPFSMDVFNGLLGELKRHVPKEAFALEERCRDFQRQYQQLQFEARDFTEAHQNRMDRFFPHPALFRG